MVALCLQAKPRCRLQRIIKKEPADVQVEIQAERGNASLFIVQYLRLADGAILTVSQ